MTQPDDQALQPLRDALAAARKSIDKKIAEAEKLAQKGEDKTAGASASDLRRVAEVFENAASSLPQSLLDIEDAFSLSGANSVELLKKVRQVAAKLSDEHTRVVLKLHPRLSPIKAAVFPLKKNEPRLVDLAKTIKTKLQVVLRVVYDDSAGIGKLYRRQDEIGTPFCITVDYQSLDDGTVTVRERDSMQQARVAVAELEGYLLDRCVRA